jgi:mediator of RNA polymerase II transcription subunit 14
MLKELREINTLLHLRLNIYEHEIADEDPASQLYFIDFRILFSPSLAEIPLGQLRAEIETKANDALKKDGLVGCYNFLHDLVLTNKIHVLRRQALEMVRGKWSETIRLETVRRSLVLQYWLHRAGGKSWVEIGLVSGKLRGKDGVLKEDGPSRIGLRWFREGKEVKNPPIVLQLGNLSMEAILKHVIALHTKHILTAIRDKLIELPLYARQSLSLSLSTSSTEPVDSSLKAELTPSRTLIVAIEPTAGRFALQPPSPPFAAAEMGLNTLKDPALEAPSRIAGLRCFVAQDEIELRARCSGWEPLRTFTPKAEDLKRIFPTKESPRLSLFRRKSWSSKWLVGVSIGMSGEDWWVFELYVVSAVPFISIIRTILMRSTVLNLRYHTHSVNTSVSRLPLRAARLLTQVMNSFLALKRPQRELYHTLSTRAISPKITSTIHSAHLAPHLHPSILESAFLSSSCVSRH